MSLKNQDNNFVASHFIGRTQPDNFVTSDLVSAFTLQNSLDNTFSLENIVPKIPLKTGFNIISYTLPYPLDASIMFLGLLQPKFFKISATANLIVANLSNSHSFMVNVIVSTDVSNPLANLLNEIDTDFYNSIKGKTGYDILGESVDIVKNGAAAALMPGSQFNGIGDLEPNQGYQLKIKSGAPVLGGDTSALGQFFSINAVENGITSENDYIQANDDFFTIPEGWSFLGYSRTRQDLDVKNLFEGEFIHPNTFAEQIDHSSALGGSIKYISHVGNFTSNPIPSETPSNVRLILGTGTSFQNDFTAGDEFQFDYNNIKISSSVNEVISNTALTVNVTNQLQPISDFYPPTPLFYPSDDSLEGSVKIFPIAGKILGNGTNFLTDFPGELSSKNIFIYISDIIGDGTATSAQVVHLGGCVVVSDTEIDITNATDASLYYNPTIAPSFFSFVLENNNTTFIPITSYTNNAISPTSYYKKGDTSGIDISSRVIIMKNNEGAAYMPEFGFNGIGDLIPGIGYQLKLTEATTIKYPPDDIRSNPSLIDDIELGQVLNSKIEDILQS